MNQPTTPPLVFQSVRDFLIRYAPFASMQDDAFEFLIPRLKLAYFPRGAVIIDRDRASFVHLHIVQNGTVASQTAGLDTQPDRLLSPGECFPVAALVAGGKPTRTYRAVEDVFVYQLALPEFEKLRALSPEFASFCSEAVATLAQQSLAELQRHYSQVAADQHSLARRLVELIPRDPVTCRIDTPLREAVTMMRDQSVRSIVLVDVDDRVKGVLTLNDLRDRVLLAEISLDTPVGEVATPNPSTMPLDATAADAIQLMAASGFHQVIVTDRGRVRGVVSERDLFGLQRVSVSYVNDAIRSARTISSLARAAADIRNLMHNLLAQGVAADALTRTIATLNDTLTRQAIALVQQNHHAIGTAWCWLALGSEGRGEQTLATDQDNAIIFVDPDGSGRSNGDRSARDGMRRLLLAFAREVNDALAELGFPLCSGGVMASNPAWCLTTDEWRECFTAWLTEPTPGALLNANIFFDMRPVAGHLALAESLLDWLLARTQDNRLFLRLMVANALQTEPPLGLIRAFVVDESPENAGTLDLKIRGSRIFVDAARVFALAQGIRDPGTAIRLREAGQRLGVESRHVTATIDAFHFLQLLRLRAQDATDAGGSNRIDPYALNEVDQRMLQEAFRQARKLQQRVKESHAAF